MDRYWMAVSAIFDLPVLASKRSVLLSYVDESRHEIDWSRISETMGAWSHGEQVLVRVAHALFNDGDDVAIHELRVLSPDVGRAVLQIIARRYW